MQPNWNESYVTVGGDKFHYTRTGHGNKPVLVLLHGFSDNGMCWMPVALALEEKFDVIMPDARGHGLSVRVQPGVQTDGTADAAGFIEALDLKKPIVGGHSMGGITATELGARFPELVSALILEDPAWIDPTPEDPPLHRNPFFEWLTNLEGASLDEVIAMGKETSPNWPEDEFPAWAESKIQLDKNVFGSVNVRKPWRELVAAFACPALLITADVEAGAIVTPEIAQEALSLSPYLKVAPIPNAGHNIRRENYPAFMDAVTDFLDQSANM
jgi:pimeloyl-ACP methyl ester carboxylesterase